MLQTNKKCMQTREGDRGQQGGRRGEDARSAPKQHKGRQGKGEGNKGTRTDTAKKRNVRVCLPQNIATCARRN